MIWRLGTVFEYFRFVMYEVKVQSRTSGGGQEIGIVVSFQKASLQFWCKLSRLDRRVNFGCRLHGGAINVESP